MVNLSEDERRYIEAALLDKNYEFVIGESDDYVLFQDVEGDGHFLPSVTILHRVTDDDVEEERERIDDLLEQFDWLSYEHLSVKTTRGDNDIAHAYPEGVSVNSNTLEAVAEELDGVDATVTTR